MQAIISISKTAGCTSPHGNYIKIEGLNTTPSITKDYARQTFASYKNIPDEEVTGFMADLLIKEISDNTGKVTVYSPVLVYRVYLITGHPNNDEVGYIDAQSGKVLATEPSITGYSATGTFATRYNGTKQATTQYYNSTYNLCDSSRNAVIHTRDLDGSTNINDADELEDSDNNWTAAEYASSEDDMGLDIHWALQEIYDYLDNEYDINSYDNPASGNGFDIKAYFHFGTSNDDRDNAGWSPSLNVLVFGDGAVKFSPVASLDAVAHEYGHGITDFQIGWGSTGDPYAFNEGMSDIWAAILEYRVSPNSIWEIAEEITLNYDCLRNIQTPDDPNAIVQIADTYLSDYYNDDSEPDLVPYIKGGVFSHWFYLLENGGSGTNDIDNDYTVYEIGMDAAEGLVVEAVFNNYLDNTTTYLQIRTNMINAANSIFGSNSFHALQVANAWYAVGVGSNPWQVTLSGSSVICNAGTVITANNSPTGSTIGWTCSNNLQVYSGGSTSTPTFKPLYTTSGGDGWVQVNYTSNGYTAAGPKKYVGVNQPYSDDVSFSLYTSGGTPVTYMCPNTYYHIYLSNGGGCSLSGYSWTIPAAWDSMYQYNNMISVYTNSSPGGRVEVAANTCCGVDRTILIDYLYSVIAAVHIRWYFRPIPPPEKRPFRC